MIEILIAIVPLALALGFLIGRRVEETAPSRRPQAVPQHDPVASVWEARAGIAEDVRRAEQAIWLLSMWRRRGQRP